MGPAMAAFLPAAVSAVSSFVGGERANRANRKEAQRNRDFQERMRNTEWQAAVTDMEAAGINPAVAYSRGGASSPGGSTASQSDTMTPAVSSALAANMQRKQLGLLDAQIAKARADAKSAQVDASMKNIDWHNAQARYSFYFEPDGRAKGPLLALLQSEYAQKLAGSARDVSQAELAKFSIPEQQAIAKLFAEVGSSGKAAQLIMPLILRLLSGRK